MEKLNFNNIWMSMWNHEVGEELIILDDVNHFVEITCRFLLMPNSV